VTYKVLPDTPATASWLSEPVRGWLQKSLDAERGPDADHGVRAQLSALRSRSVLHLSAVHLTFAIGSYGFNLFVPLIIKQINPGYSSTNIGFVAVVPYVCAAFALMASSRIAKSVKSLTAVVTIPLSLIAVGLVLVIAFRNQPGLALVALSLTAAANFAFLPPFWALVTNTLSNKHAAVGIAVINSVGNLGGFFGPYLVGQGAKGSTVTAGLLIPVISLVASTVLLILWSTVERQAKARAQAELVPES
jgi:MFS transporter, ACS family, tartrate transporter